MEVDPPSIPMKPETVWPGRNPAAVNFFFLYADLKCNELRVFCDKAFATGCGFFFRAAVIDVVEKLLGSEITAYLGLLIFAELDRSQSGEVLGVLRYLDQLLWSNAFGDLDFALLPHTRNVGLPRLAHATDKSVGAAKEKNMGAQCMSARQHAKVLQHDGFEERGHQFMRGSAGLLQTIDVGFGKDAALAGDLMQFDAVIGLVGKLGGWDLQLGVDLVDDRSRAASALVIHRRDLLLASGLFVIFEDDDFCVLSAQFDYGVHLGMQLLDCERDGMHFLNELCADHLSDGAAA